MLNVGKVIEKQIFKMMKNLQVFTRRTNGFRAYHLSGNKKAAPTLGSEQQDISPSDQPLLTDLNKSFPYSCTRWYWNTSRNRHFLPIRPNC